MKKYNKGQKIWFAKEKRPYTIRDVTGQHSWEGSHSRGAEIEAWTVQHPEVENYVIIDDEDDMLDEQLFHIKSAEETATSSTSPEESAGAFIILLLILFP